MLALTLNQGEEEEDAEGYADEKVDADETARTITTVSDSARLNPLQLHILELVLEDLGECMDALAPGADGTASGSGACTWAWLLVLPRPRRDSRA